MRKLSKITSVFSLIFFLINISCQDTNEDSRTDIADDGTQAGSLEIEMSEESMGSLPMVAPESSSVDTNNTGTLETGLYLNSYSIGDVVDLDTIRRFFKYECHMNYTDSNFCPSTLDLPADSSQSNYKFTTTTLIGLIHHAEMYMDNIYSKENSDDDTKDSTLWLADSDTKDDEETGEKDDGVENIENDNYVFISTTTAEGVADSSGKPDTFIIPFSGLYNFLEVESGSSSTPMLYRNAKDKAKYVALILRKHNTGGSSNWSMSDIMQAYLTTYAGEGKILAYNIASVNDITDSDASSLQRAILMVNFQTRQFIVKYRMSDTQLIAIGKAGRDKTTGELLDGYYYVKAYTGATLDFDGCVDNKTQTMVEESNCTNEKTLFDNDFDVTSYLGLTGAEPTDVSGFIDFLNNGTLLADKDTPTSVSDIKHFPDSVSVE